MYVCVRTHKQVQNLYSLTSPTKNRYKYHSCGTTYTLYQNIVKFDLQIETFCMLQRFITNFLKKKIGSI